MAALFHGPAGTGKTIACKLIAQAISRMLTIRVPECEPVVGKIFGVYHKIKKRTEAKELLAGFQCDYIRSAEETFAQTLAENEKVRLFFINENEAFTDGRNIVVDPAVDELFTDRNALDQTAEFLK